VSDDLFLDCTYIGINKSPRSDTLPKFYNIEFIDFDLGVNVKTTIQNLLNILPRLGKLQVSTKKVLIEYDGNFLLNLLLNLKFLTKDIYIDCHNSAVENEKGKSLRYYLNLTYLFCSKIIFRSKIIVHNHYIMDSYPLESIVVITPYPELSRYRSEEKINDILFSCSLNSDEPIETIIFACRELEKKGYKAQITGDFKKLPENIQEMGAPFFSGYITNDSYFELLGRSKVMICLTNRTKTLLYSPREGISLGLKVIITSSQVNRDFFGEKAIYLHSEANLVQEIINAIE